MASNSGARITGCKIGASLDGLPHAQTILLPLGFDEVSLSKNSLLARKIHSRDILGSPLQFFEARLAHDSISISYGAPRSYDEHICAIRAAAQLLRIISVFPKAKVNAADFSNLILPALDAAEMAVSQDFSMLAKRHRDLQSDFLELSAKNRRLSRAAEETALLLAEAEQKISSQKERISALEAVPDAMLGEMLLGYLRAHRGNFDPAAFSKSAGVPPQRSEEGLQRLLSQGKIRQVGRAFLENGPKHSRVFEEKNWRLPHFSFRGRKTHEKKLERSE